MLERYLIRHCSPTLASIKTANLFNIRFENGKVNIIVDGALFKDVHSLSLDYIKGAPMLFACVSDVGETREQWQNSKFMS